MRDTVELMQRARAAGADAVAVHVREKADRPRQAARYGQVRELCGSLFEKKGGMQGGWGLDFKGVLCPGERRCVSLR